MGEEMKASKENIKPNDVIIFLADEWRDGTKTDDGNALSVSSGKVELMYLSGHRTRYDVIPYSDVIAKVDKSQSRIKLDNAPFMGYFLQFDHEVKR